MDTPIPAGAEVNNELIVVDTYTAELPIVVYPQVGSTIKGGFPNCLNRAGIFSVLNVPLETSGVQRTQTNLPRASYIFKGFKWPILPAL